MSIHPVTVFRCECNRLPNSMDGVGESGPLLARLCRRRKAVVGGQPSGPLCSTHTSTHAQSVHNCRNQWRQFNRGVGNLFEPPGHLGKTRGVVAYWDVLCERPVELTVGTGRGGSMGELVCRNGKTELTDGHTRGSRRRVRALRSS